jgi:hypothetical protein
MFALSNLQGIVSDIDSTKFLETSSINTALLNTVYAFAYTNKVPYGKYKTRDNSNGGEPIIKADDLCAALSPYERAYDGLLNGFGAAVDFEATTTSGAKKFKSTMVKNGAFVAQDIAPYNSGQAKYSIYNTRNYSSEAAISYRNYGSRRADSAITAAYDAGAKI